MGKTIRSATIAAQNWQDRTKNAAQFYKDQVQAAAWKVYASSDNAEKNYATGVQNAVSKKSRQAGVNSASDEAWKAGVASVGQTRFSGGVDASRPKMEAAMGKLIPQIDNIRKSLSPRGVRGSPENIKRSADFQTKLAALRGSFKAHGVSRAT